MQCCAMTRINFPFYTRSNECVYTNDIVKCNCNVCISPFQNVYAWVKDSEFRHNAELMPKLDLPEPPHVTCPCVAAEITVYISK